MMLNMKPISDLHNQESMSRYFYCMSDDMLHYHITRECVRQIVCHTIGNHWNRNSLALLSDHFGHAVSFRERREGETPNGAGKPTNGAFIEMLAEYLKYKYCL